METAGTSAAPRGMRTFLIIWLGELISIVGSGMTGFALGVWIFQRTGEATPFALTVLFANLPRVLLLPAAGTLADRWNRRWLMILSDLGAALTTLAVVILLSLGSLEIWHIYIIVSLGSVFGAFQEPAYRSSITMLVPKEHLGRASGMMSAGDAISMLIAPLLGGMLFGIIGMRGIVIIDFVTCFFAVGALLLVRIPQPATSAEEKGKPRSMRSDMAFAWGYLVQRPGLFWMVWYFALVNFLFNLVMVLNGPLVLSFADAQTYGLIQVVSGVGMLAGSILMGAWGGPKRRVVGIFAFIALSAVGLVVMGIQPSPWLIGAGLFLMLFGVPIGSGCSAAISQTKIEPSVQGRVFAMRGMISQSMMPVAFLIAGPLADKVFGPLMMESGALAPTLGPILGVGTGRGIGLMFVAAGLILLAVTALAWGNHHIRNVETELPDVKVVAEGEEEEKVPTGEAVPSAA